MAKGKRGGRAKGVPNRRTEDTRRLIEETIGASPLERMARLAQELLDGKHKLQKPMVVDKQIQLVEDRGFQLRLAADLFSEVAQYHSPKRKALELTGAEGGAIEAHGLKVSIVQSRDAA